MTLTFVPEPTVLAVEPDLECVEDGDQPMKLTGAGFLSVDGRLPVVLVDGSLTFPAIRVDGCLPVPGPVRTVAQTCTSLGFVLPKGSVSPGRYAVKVKNPAPADCTSSTSAPLEMLPSPVLAAVVPDLACNAQGMVTLTLAGAGLVTVDGVLPRVTFAAATAGAVPVVLAASAALGCTDIVGLGEAVQTDAFVDAPLGSDVLPDLPPGPDTVPDVAPDLDMGTDTEPVDTTPMPDLAGDTADAAPDTLAPDVESDTPPACAGALCDDFEDGDSAGWSIIGDGVAADRAVALDGTNHVLQQHTDTNATLRLARAGQTGWTEQTVQVRLKVLSYGAGANTNRALVCARTVSASSAYCLAISADGGGTLTMLKRRPRGGGTWDVLGSPVTGIGVAADTWHTIRLVVSGASPAAITAYVDPTGTPTPALTANDATQPIAAGNFAAGTEGTQAAFDDVLVTTP